MLAQKIAGWAKRVLSCTRAKGSSPTSSTQRSSSSGRCCATASRMSGVWLPCPGKSNAMSVVGFTLCTLGVAGPTSHPKGRCTPPRGGQTHGVGGPALVMVPGVLRSVKATRYVTPLREGGSLPGLVEADDDGLYVCKFRGAGQGEKALIAEVIAGELARAAGLAVPEIVAVELDPALGAAEPDPEIQDLINASAGTNVGLDFLPGSLPFSPAGGFEPDAQLAADVVWLDALVSNVDRTRATPTCSSGTGGCG